eukprot:6127246-Prymnesium_polylepis.2
MRSACGSRHSVEAIDVDTSVEKPVERRRGVMLAETKKNWSSATQLMDVLGGHTTGASYQPLDDGTKADLAEQVEQTVDKRRTRTRLDETGPRLTISCYNNTCENSRDSLDECEVLSVDVHPSGLIVMGDSLGSANVWTMEGTKRHTLECGGKVRCVRLVQVGSQTLLTTADSAHHVRVWDATSGTMTMSMLCNSDVYGCDMSLNGKTVASAEANGFLCVWDTKIGRTTRAMNCPKRVRLHSAILLGELVSSCISRHCSGARYPPLRRWHSACIRR